MTTHYEELLTTSQRLLRVGGPQQRHEVVEAHDKTNATLQELRTATAPISAGVLAPLVLSKTPPAISASTQFVAADDPRRVSFEQAVAVSASSLSGRVVPANVWRAMMGGSYFRTTTVGPASTGTFVTGGATYWRRGTIDPAGRRTVSLWYGAPTEPRHEVIDSHAGRSAFLVSGVYAPETSFANALLCDVVGAARIQDAITLVYRRFDKELLVRQFAGVRLTLLASAQSAGVAIDVLLSMLTATLPWKHALPERAVLIDAVRARAATEYGEGSVEAMLRGLT